MPFYRAPLQQQTSFHPHTTLNFRQSKCFMLTDFFSVLSPDPTARDYLNSFCFVHLHRCNQTNYFHFFRQNIVAFAVSPH